MFPVFFMLIYALISYGLAFLVRESMQFAVEDGARAALRYQPTRDARFSAVNAVVQHNLGWLPARLQPTANNIQITVCRLGSSSTCAANLICGSDAESRCLVHVQLQIPYGLSPLAPSLPGLSVLVPEALSASASVLVDAGGL